LQEKSRSFRIDRTDLKAIGSGCQFDVRQSLRPTDSGPNFSPSHGASRSDGKNGRAKVVAASADAERGRDRVRLGEKPSAKYPHGDSNPGLLAENQKNPRRNSQSEQELTDAFAKACAPACAVSPELERVIDAWPTLPAHIRRAIMALVCTDND
jgi:hypothetical protein